MDTNLQTELLQVYREALQPPFCGSFREWAESNIVLPPAYAIPGKLDLAISPYLHKPMRDIDNPNITQVNLCMATQIGKSLVEELFIPYTIINNPGPVFRIFHNKEVSDVFAETRLIPLLKNCEPIKPLLRYDRFSTKKNAISLPHVAVTMGSSNTSLAHGMSVKYLLCDELWQWEPGQFNKFLARTTAFAGRRKIICSSQPSKSGHEWEQICHKGKVYDWQWSCPKCNARQPFYWSKERDDGSYGGFNWDTVLLPDGSTNIELSSRTTELECINCRHRITDTPCDRNYINQTGEYICTKSDGDPAVVTYMAPCFVNVNISFASRAAEYMIAKQTKKLTGLDELMEIFVEQSLGKFYKREQSQEVSKILIELYAKEKLDNTWVNTMGVDVQRTGKVKYYVIRAWNKNGNESRRIAFGIARTWEEIELMRVKHNVLLPMVHVDSGDGVTVGEVYQQCLLHGLVLKSQYGLQYISWTPTKGDGNKTSYKHPDNVTRLYAPESAQDAQFPVGHKLKGVPAKLVLFSNFSLKTILTNIRDNRIEGVKWLVDHADEEYDKQLYSEGLVDVVDKKSGLITQRWLQQAQDNHYLDVELLCLLGALRANAFSATKINEADIQKLIDNSKPKTV